MNSIPSGPAASLGMTHNAHPLHITQLLLLYLPMVLNSQIISHILCCSPLDLFSSSLLSSSSIYFQPFLLYPFFFSPSSSYSFSNLFENSHFRCFLSCLPCLPLHHPCAPFPSRAVLSPAFRPEIGFGKEPGHKPRCQRH